MSKPLAQVNNGTMDMGHHTLHGNPPIEVALRRSSTAKRLSLRVSRLDGRVTLTIPKRARVPEAVAFLEERESWLRGHLSQVRELHVVEAGGTVPFAGRLIPVVAGRSRRAMLTEDALHVPNEQTAGQKAQALLKAQARNVLASASDRYAAQIGKTYARLSLRDTRSRWGSCSSKGTLMYSWRLIMAPPEVLDYVAAHEVAHLAEMNHSPAFWAVVERLYGDHMPARRWLRENGDQLHRVQFGD
ncbi:SprT family zinc-dependent metalloprotease [Loktanella sp. F6476L]|uniref:M48 family metallopeptidase n=1 Tax=Loktanella sp. F6476L TaxID=2926405 RepID=UPI0032B22F72